MVEEADDVADDCEERGADSADEEAFEAEEADWLDADVTGGSWEGCCRPAWFEPARATISNIPVTPTARSVVVAMADLMNSRLFVSPTSVLLGRPARLSRHSVGRPQLWS